MTDIKQTDSLGKVIETLDEASDGFGKIADRQQKKMYDEVLLLCKDLEVLPNGKVKQSIANLKRLTMIKARLAALAKDKEWVAGIGQFLRYFNTIQDKQTAYYKQQFKVTDKAKEKHQLMKELAVQNTIDSLIGDGLKANVTDKLNDILLRAVTSGEKFADLQEELRTHMLGTEGGQGAFARYATTYATTAISQFTGQNNKMMTDDLGCDWFMYVGSNKETTREFCEQLTKKKFIHRSEIRTILTGKIDEYQCAIYPATGLPYGMIAGTNEENFQCNCGGWNCRHQLVPVADAVVPASIRARLELQNPIELEKQNVEKEIKTSVVAKDMLINSIREYLMDHDSPKINGIYEDIINAKMNGDDTKLLDLIKSAKNDILKFESSKVSQKFKEMDLDVFVGNWTPNYKKIDIVSDYKIQMEGYDLKTGTLIDGSIKRECAIAELRNGVKIIAPTDIDNTKQHISMNQMARVAQDIPSIFNIQEVRLVDIKNPADDWWSLFYYGGKKPFISFATDGGKTTFYANNRIEVCKKLKSTLLHEAGHDLDDRMGRPSSSAEYKDAVFKDYAFSSKEWVSAYPDRVSQNNTEGAYREDFAESLSIMFTNGKASFSLRFPYRYAYFKKIGII